MPEPDPPTPVLEVDGLEVRYRSVPAVRGIDVHVAAGEVVAIVGPNGAGKSSALAAIMGLAPVHRGDVRLRGESVVGARPERIARKGIALVPEGRHVFGAFTVAENLRLGLLGRPSAAGADDDVAWVHDLFPVVAEFSTRRAGLLSGGQQQQLAIARALVADPAVLLLDEPSLGLAPAVVDALFGALRRVRERGVAVVLVEQRAELAISFADRTHVMRDGRLVLDVEPGVATDVSLLTAAYFGT